MAFAVPAAEVADAAAGRAAATAAGKKSAAKKAAAKKPAPGPEPAAEKTAAAPAAKKSAAAPAKKSAAAPARKSAAGGSGGARLPRPKRAAAWLMSGNVKLLTAEYIACVAVLGAGTLLAPQGSKDGATRGMVKFTALSALFFLLALVASAGKGAARGATALGALITAAYLFTSSDVHNVANWTAVFFSPSGDVTPQQPGGSGPTVEQQAQAAVGSMLPGPANGQTPGAHGGVPGQVGTGAGSGFGIKVPGEGGGVVTTG